MTKFALAATAITASFAVAQPASAATGHESSAFGISATGLVSISPTPAVAASAGERQQSRSLVSLPNNALLNARVLGVSAGSHRARASVADVEIAKARLSAETVSATCVNGKGSTKLVRVKIGDRTIQSAPTPNTTVPVTLDRLGTVTVTLNKQQRRADGRLTVTALSVRIPMGHNNALQTVDVSSATCGAPMDAPQPPDGGDDGGNGGNGGNGGSNGGSNGGDDNTAPVPTPVKGDLPVTG